MVAKIPFFEPGAAYIVFTLLVAIPVLSVVISVITLNKVAKSKNTIKSKIYFNFIFNIFLFGLIIFTHILQWFSPYSLDREGFGLLFFVLPVVLVLVTIMSVVGIVIILHNAKNDNFLEYNINKLSKIYTSVIVIIVLLVFVTANFGNQLYETAFNIDTPDNVVARGLSCDNATFGKSKEDQASGLSSCYNIEAMKTGNPAICLKGIKNSVPNMANCLIEAAGKSSDPSICDNFNKKVFGNYQPYAYVNDYSYYGSEAEVIDKGRCLNGIRVLKNVNK